MFFFETAIICFIGIETSAEQGRVCRHRSALVVEGVWRCQLVAMGERVATVYVHCLCGNTPTLILSCRLLVTVSMVWGDHRSAACSHLPRRLRRPPSASAECCSSVNDGDTLSSRKPLPFTDEVNV